MWPIGTASTLLCEHGGGRLSVAAGLIGPGETALRSTPEGRPAQRKPAGKADIPSFVVCVSTIFGVRHERDTRCDVQNLTVPAIAHPVYDLSRTASWYSAASHRPRAPHLRVEIDELLFLPHLRRRSHSREHRSGPNSPQDISTRWYDVFLICASPVGFRTPRFPQLGSPPPSLDISALSMATTACSPARASGVPLRPPCRGPPLSRRQSCLSGGPDSTPAIDSAATSHPHIGFEFIVADGRHPQ